MIAVWMTYALASGMLIALLCWFLERIARAARFPTRGIWAAGMATMLLVAAAAAVPDRPASTTLLSPALTEAASPGLVEDGDVPTSQGLLARLVGRVESAMVALELRVAEAIEGFSRWDLPLLAFWGIGTAFLSGIVAHAALEGRRLRQGLRPQEVGGTPVLLTEDIGPSAVGVGGPAILIPRWALDLDDALMTLIVRHEREHLVARDPHLLLAAVFGVVLLPWHLPLWWSRKRLRLAIEVDCDSRVLRAHPDVRRYGQLLLLTAQRAPKTAWALLAIVTVVAPLRPQATHLARRIATMTQPRRSRVVLRALPLIAGAIAILGLLFALPAPRGAQAQSSTARERAIVHLTSVGAYGTGPSLSIVVYTSGGGQVGIGTDPPRAITDTLRLDRLPAMTADVTDGDVHIELRGPGRIKMGGEVTGGPALTVSATGRHLVLLKGGVGIRGLP